MLLFVRLLDFYSFIVLAAAVMTWMQVRPTHPLAEFVRKITEPALEPLRRLVPDIAGLDFSPLILLVGIQVFRGLLIGALF